MARAIFRNHMNTVERVTVYGHTSSLSDSVRLRHGSGGGRIGGGTSAVRARCGACTFIFTYIHIYIYNINEANYYMIGGGTRPHVRRMARASRSPWTPAVLEL